MKCTDGAICAMVLRERERERVCVCEREREREKIREERYILWYVFVSMIV
jgi:hypothetical protein